MENTEITKTIHWEGVITIKIYFLNKVVFFLPQNDVVKEESA